MDSDHGGSLKDLGTFNEYQGFKGSPGRWPMGTGSEPRTCLGISLRFNNINVSIYLKTINQFIALLDLHPIHHMSTAALLRRSLHLTSTDPKDFDLLAVILFFIIHTTFHCSHFLFFSSFSQFYFHLFTSHIRFSSVLVVSAIFDSNAFMIFFLIITLYNTLILPS